MATRATSSIFTASATGGGTDPQTATNTAAISAVQTAVDAINADNLTQTESDALTAAQTTLDGTQSSDISGLQTAVTTLQGIDNLTQAESDALVLAQGAVDAAQDTAISTVMSGASAGAAGASGRVPQPVAGDQNSVLTGAASFISPLAMTGDWAGQGEQTLGAFLIDLFNTVNPMEFTTQPSVSGIFEVGETLTINEGIFSEGGAVITITEFTLDGVDKTGELAGLDWDTTGESVYGVPGEIALQVQANPGANDSLRVTYTLTSVPDAFVLADWSVVDGASGDLNVTVTTLPDDGNAPNSDIEYRVDGGAPVSSGGLVGFNIPSLSDGSHDVEMRAVNAVGFGVWSDLKSEIVTGAAAPVTLNSLTVGAVSGGSLPLTMLAVETPDDVSPAHFVMVPTGETAPSATQIQNGQNHLGASPTHAFTKTWTASPPNETLPNGLDGFFDLYGVVNNGSLSNVVSQINFEADSINLFLNSQTPTDNETGVALDANIIFDFSDDVGANGTITLKLVGGANVEVFDLSTGLGDSGGTVTLTANAATTDRVTVNPGFDMLPSTAYAMQRAGVTDEMGNPIADISDDTTHNFTTDVAPSGMALTYLGGGSADGAPGDTDKTITGIDTTAHNDTDDLVAMIGAYNVPGSITSVTLDGVAALQIETQSIASSGTCLVAAARFPGQAYADSATVVITSSTTVQSAGFALSSVNGAVTTMTVPAGGSQTTTVRTNSDVSINTTAGAALFAAQQQRDGVVTSITGLSEVDEFEIRTGEVLTVGLASTVNADTPRTIQFDDNAISQHKAALVVEIT